MVTPSQPLLSITYSSVATTPFSDNDLAALLTVSRRNNTQTGITGLLLYRDGRFLQVLEGPETALRDLMGRIDADSGHHSVRTLLEAKVQGRQFPEWTMGYHPDTAASRANIPGYRDAFDDLDHDENGNETTLTAIRALTAWFRDHHASDA